MVALGNFDGAHLGHAHLLRTAHGARPDAPLAVLTFEPHPREFFHPDDPPFRLTLSAERAAALAALNVTLISELPFTHEFSLMPAEKFVAEVLQAGIGARHLVCGPDFAFGHRRGGDATFLAARAEALGIGLTVVPLLLLSNLCFGWMYESRNYMPLVPLLATTAVAAFLPPRDPTPAAMPGR